MTDPAPSRLIPLALTGAAALVVAGGVMFWRASQTAPGPERGAIHEVSVGTKTCDPADFTLPAGRTTFRITNASDRPIEWEILDGVMVVAERENIAPGFKSDLTVKLVPGNFEITCGLLSNPRGRLVVEPSAESEAERIAPPQTAFIGPLSEYKVYLVTQSRRLTTAAEALDRAVQAGDLDAAKQAWLDARLPYRRMEVVTGRIADLENAIDPLPDYLERREDDPAFTGFHRLEMGLWRDGSTEGLAPVSERLLADVTALQDRLRGMKLAPADLAATASQHADRMAAGQIPLGEDRWAQSDLAGLDAGLEGLEKQVRLLDPLFRGASPDLGARVDAAFADAHAALDATKDQGGWPGYDTVDDPARTALAQPFQHLSAVLAEINAAIGLE